MQTAHSGEHEPGARQRRLLAINFFPAFTPPSSGGEQRWFYVYQHLSRHFDVTLVSATFPSGEREEVVHSPTFREIRVPKPREADSIHWQLSSEGIGPECSAIAVALAAPFDVALTGVIAELAPTMDVIVHASPFTVPYDKGMGTDGVMRVYDAYNVEYKLAEQIFSGEIGQKCAEFVRFLEGELLAHADAVLAISDEEAATFVEEFGFRPESIIPAPNGFEPSSTALEESTSRGRDVLFLGSAHPPNVEALRYIIDHLAPAMPDVQFNVIGSVCKSATGEVPANLALLGFVTEDAKSRLLSACGAAINPLSSGAGTNLKMLDYLAHGAPVVSTSVGARGLPLTDGLELRIAQLSTFPDVLSNVLDNPADSARLASAGRSLVQSRYAWNAIADVVAGRLHAALDERARRPRRTRILTVCDYPVDRPMGGGQVRIKELLTELGREFDVTFVCFTDELESCDTAIAPGVVQKAIAKSAEHRGRQAQLDAGQAVSIADVLAGEYCGQGSPLHEAFVAELGTADVVLFEQCYLAPLLDVVPAGVPVVYSSQNVEAELKDVLYTARADGAAWLARVHQLEAIMLARSAVTICVSNNDSQAFGRLHADVNPVVIENGVRLAPAPVRDIREQGELAIFLGSAHPPNVRAARFIIDTLAPALPKVSFGLAGSVCSAVAGSPIPANVLLLGFLSGEEKAALLAIADVAVNPLFDGGGSSLKVPDFFAAGLPTITSAVGVRGYHAVDGVHYEGAEASSFASVVERVMASLEHRTRLSHHSRRFAEEELDWELIGGRFRRTLRRLMPASPVARMLVATYRFGAPPRGGAETFLLNVLHHLDRQDGLAIDVASTKVGPIQDVLHFSAAYASPEARDHVPAMRGDVHYFDVDPQPEDAFRRAQALEALWMDESLELGHRLAPRLTAAALLGGWNHPESAADGTVCWAGMRSQLRVPPGASRCRLAATLPHGSARLEIKGAGGKRFDKKISGAFVADFAVAHDDEILEVLCDTKLASASDARMLSFLASSIRLLVGDQWLEVDLGMTLETRARSLDVDAWVADLVAVTDARDPAADEEFVRLRGPHSRQMDAWLGVNASTYDVVLVQGVPFATVPAVVRRCRRAGVPCIVLPHFHMEDRYYHWQAFYEAFRHADAVVAAPAQSQRSFFDRVGARSIVLAGGGLDPADFTPERIEQGRKAFAGVHASTRPFVLILGRKAGAKHYNLALRAAAMLREQGTELDVVMIGPDDDGVAIAPGEAAYYGMQPREVVVGALASARCLINMSDSESFGIVLLEAWMAGTPVIARRSCTAFAELVEDGVNGFLVDELDTAVHSMAGYLDDEDLARRHAAEGQRVADRYTWSSLAGKLAKLAGVVATAGEPR